MITWYLLVLIIIYIYKIPHIRYYYVLVPAHIGPVQIGQAYFLNHVQNIVSTNPFLIYVTGLVLLQSLSLYIILVLNTDWYH